MAKSVFKSRRLGVLFLLLMLLKVGIFCFSYQPMLDDYIQLGLYGMHPDRWQDSVLAAGLLAGRPLAGLMDVYVWSSFYHCLWVPMLLLTIGYAAALWLLYRLFSEWFSCSPFFLAVAGFVPICMEGTFWLAAATRTVPPLLLGALAAQTLWRWKKARKPGMLWLFFVLFFCSLGFYEQGILFSGMLCLLVLLRGERKRLWPAVGMMALACALMGSTYVLVPKGQSVSRVALINLSADVAQHIAGISHEVFLLWGRTNLSLTASSLREGIAVLHGRLWYGALLLILAAALFVVVRRLPACRTGAKHSLLIGAVLFLVPLLIFFAQKNAFLALRSAVCCLPGAALLCDGVARLVLNHGRAAMAGLCAVVICCGCLCCSGELSFYRQAWAYDRAVIAAVYPAAQQYGREQRIGVLNLSTYVTDAVRYGEHVYAISSSEWALTGAMYAARGEKGTAAVRPFELGSVVATDLDALRALAITGWYYYEDGLLVPVELVSNADGLCFVSDGQTVALLQQQNGLVLKDGEQ